MSPLRSIDTLPVNRRDWRDSRGTLSLSLPFETHKEVINKTVRAELEGRGEGY